MDTYDRGWGCRPNWHHITLHHNNPLLFVTSQWNWPQGAYVFYRIVVAVYWVTWTVLSGIDEDSSRWFIFLVNWALLLLAISSVWRAWMATEFWILKNCGRPLFKKPGLPWYIKVPWVLTNLEKTAVTFAVIFFWSYEWDGTSQNAVAINSYAISLVLIIVDLFISAQPLRFLHVYQSLIFGAIYLIFTVIYQHLADELIYEDLDWIDDLHNALIVTFVVLLIGIPLVWLVFFGLDRLRIHLNTLECCACRKNEYQVKVHIASTSVRPHTGVVVHRY